MGEGHGPLRATGGDLDPPRATAASIQFILRVRDDREAEYARFVEDLESIGKRAKQLAGA